MSVKQEVFDYLDECKVFFFSTVKGEAPVTRPLGFKMMLDGEMYFGVGTFKDVYAQMKANPNVYLCACKPDASGWIRISGKAVFDEDRSFEEAAFKAAPHLEPVYKEHGWSMGVFHLEDARATFIESPMTPVKTVEF